MVLVSHNNWQGPAHMGGQPRPEGHGWWLMGEDDIGRIYYVAVERSAEYKME